MSTVAPPPHTRALLLLGYWFLLSLALESYLQYYKALKAVMQILTKIIWIRLLLQDIAILDPDPI